MSGNITVIPGEISKFKNSKAKPFNEKQIVKLLKEAFPVNPEDMEDSDDEDEDGEEYEYEQINVTMPLNKIVKTYVHNTCKITPYFFRDFGNVFITDDFKHIRLATT